MKAKIYVEQTNADVYEIDIPDSFPEESKKEYAINKAKEMWRKENYPQIREVVIEVFV